MKQNRHRYILLNKPYGVLCDFEGGEPAPDAQRGADGKSSGQPSLRDYLLPPGVQPAGRLDLDSEGLVLLCDDGEVIHRLAHPRYHQHKTYLVQVERVPEEAALAALRAGVMVKGQRTAPAEVEMLAEDPDLAARAVPVQSGAGVPTAWLRMVLTEGRKRQIRHMTAAVGHPTLRLVRIGVGPLALGDVQPGEWRDLTAEELWRLRAALGLAGAVPG